MVYSCISSLYIPASLLLHVLQMIMKYLIFNWSKCKIEILLGVVMDVKQTKFELPSLYMHTDFALLCFVVVIHWLIFPYPSGLLHWHCGNLTIAPVPAKQPWWIWINTSCEFIMNDCITTTKQSTTKPCAYFLGYSVWYSIDLFPSFTKCRCYHCIHILQPHALSSRVYQRPFHIVLHFVETPFFSNLRSVQKFHAISMETAAVEMFYLPGRFVGFQKMKWQLSTEMHFLKLNANIQYIWVRIHYQK